MSIIRRYRLLKTRGEKMGEWKGEHKHKCPDCGVEFQCPINNERCGCNYNNYSCRNCFHLHMTTFEVRGGMSLKSAEICLDGIQNKKFTGEFGCITCEDLRKILRSAFLNTDTAWRRKVEEEAKSARCDEDKLSLVDEIKEGKIDGL